MAWGFLHHRSATGSLLDPYEYDDNISSVSHEADGNLNEQNFQPLILEEVISNGTADPALALVIYAEKEPRDPHDEAVTGFVVPQFEHWGHVDGTEITFRSRGGKICVIASFQCQMDASTYQTGLNFALELDGAAMASSLLGTGDQGNDFIDGGGFALPPVPAPSVIFDYGTSPSFRAVQTPHQIYGVFDIEPGEHTVFLVTRNLGTVTPCEQWITNCEIILLDGWC